jgi:hypothetical protein
MGESCFPNSILRPQKHEEVMMISAQKNTTYFRASTKLPPYLPFPAFLLELELSMTAKVVYALLLNRMTLSQKNDWIDEWGRVYIVYPIDNLAKAMHKSRSTVKYALNELSQCGLLERHSNGFGTANMLYVKLPQEEENSSPIGQKTDRVGSENRPSIGQKTDLAMVRKLTPNYLIETTNNNHLSEGKPLTPFGSYENVFLSQEEYVALSQEFPQSVDRYIEEMSRYQAASGKTYQNYAAALRIWAANDRKAPASTGLPAYTYQEGESF